MFSPSTRGTCIVVLFVATLCSGMGKLILQEVEWILCAWLLSFFYGLIYSFQENFDSGWCLLKFPVQRTNTTFAVVPVVATDAIWRVRKLQGCGKSLCTVSYTRLWPDFIQRPITQEFCLAAPLKTEMLVNERLHTLRRREYKGF